MMTTFTPPPHILSSSVFAQGLGDEEIPPERALELSDAISSRDVIVTYVKYGKHALDDFEDDFRRV